ncbi:MAG: secondary thiamine-phosphate synthase enzyme YjbQ [Candidatus Marinimicrobia bacterium]|nr:secondary thiamine-phosphate synthase enzyme YjbQ [bacterium]MCG2716133.1 secondary thiamine-phosphate synthase enzyme YjbQ [Candidatus Neomarinimicrobiota bacterium]
MIFGKTIILWTKGFSDIKDITGKVQAIVDRSGLKSGIATITAIGSTASVTTIEFEPALVQDMQEQLEKFASRHMHSHHSQTWGDDNGFSHIRASFMGPGITIPFTNGKLVLGTWQQIVVIDHDNSPRQRQIFVQIIGE